MKTLFSILYVPISTTLDERVSIGLIMFNGEQHFFKYSALKLQAIKGLLDSESNTILKTYLKTLEKEINSSSGTADELFDVEISAKANWINTSYISYLSKYSNNLIQFSEAKTIEIPLNSTNFKKVFEKYIFQYNEVTEVDESISVYQKVKAKLYPNIVGKVNVDKTVTPNDFKNLIAPFEVNFIGLNGVPVAGQAIDFEKQHFYLENDISRFIALTNALELDEKRDGKYFVLGREPKVNHNQRNHLMWEQIRDSDFLEFVDIDEVGIVEDYINKNNVAPFFN
ncbi:hypothetical protein EZJ43_04895 [Pedobacter changchengzhani]|uniref:DUF3037 domain-containing protein n=1 Tax=Pedobacter changchengzhani TaxID=2529274 RepID=A0A4R5MQ07_9SPHI|nr:hypothetical protein [Pedobacter changchengzhani]TDG37455.1 hypothetical protein EZJ43_04895 [Pedobacter changchengzhani]